MPKLRHFVFSLFLMVGQSKEMTRKFLEEEEMCVSPLWIRMVSLFLPRSSIISSSQEMPKVMGPKEV
jgi:hypothetical protein